MKGKQRSYLKSLANRLDVSIQIGKGGVTDNVVIQIDDLLEAKELVKIKLLNNSLLEGKNVSEELCKRLDAEFVQSIGNKIVIYRESENKKTIVLPR